MSHTPYIMPDGRPLGQFLQETQVKCTLLLTFITLASQVLEVFSGFTRWNSLNFVLNGLPERRSKRTLSVKSEKEGTELCRRLSLQGASGANRRQGATKRQTGRAAGHRGLRFGRLLRRLMQERRTMRASGWVGTGGAGS